MQGFEIAVCIVWLLPLLVLSNIVYGYIRAKCCFKSTNSTKNMIIQITTIGNHDMVNKIVSKSSIYLASLSWDVFITPGIPVALQNAKMHLMEAVMDLKSGNTKGAMMEMNSTDRGIKMHEQEIKSMMMEVRSMMAQMKGNTTSSSMVSKNATS